MLAQISQVLLEEGEEGGQVMFVGVRMSETVTFARVNLNTIILVTIFSDYGIDRIWVGLSERLFGFSGVSRLYCFIGWGT